MSEVVTNPVTENPNPVVTPNPEVQNPNPTPEPSKEVVSKADHERALADMHKFKRELEKMKTDKETEKTAKMKEQQQWKELAEAKEREASELKSSNDRLQQSYLNEKRFTALKSACEKLGLRAEAAPDLDLVDISEVQIETTSTGKINVLGAEKFAERLKTVRPHWFADKSAPSVNTSGARVIDTGGVITPEMLINAEKEGRKKGDLSEYTSLHQKYRSQLAGARRA